MPVNMSWEISESWAGIISLRPNNRHDKSDRLNDKIFRKTDIKLRAERNMRERFKSAELLSEKDGGY